MARNPKLAAAMLVMQDFFEKYENILLRADLTITLLRVYVDDGRQVTSLLRKGLRYSLEEEGFVWSKEAEQEDKAKEKEGESREAFMARLCLPAMNGINPDLTFTVETAEDFRGNKLPTLDFNLYMKDDMRLTHGYYETEMKSQMVVGRELAMGTRQKFSILSNEIARRLYSIEEIGIEEKEEEQMEVMEDYTRQLKNSGWSRKEALQII